MRLIKINRINVSKCIFINLLGLLLISCAIRKEVEHSTIIQETFHDSTFIPNHWVTNSDTNAVSDNWLKTFNDPILDSIVAEAIRNNFDLKGAANNVTIAQQNIIVVSSKMKPQIGIDASYTGIVDDENATYFGSAKAFALVSWEPDIWGKVRAQEAEAIAKYQATAFDYKYAIQSLAATVAKSWYLAVEASQIVSLFESVVEIQSEVVELVKVKRKLGKVGDLDVAEATANLNEVQNALLQSQGIYEETKRNLEVLLGRYPSAEIQTAKDFSPLPPPVKAGIPSVLIERRPDIVAAEKLVIAAFRKEEAAELALLPSFPLTLGGGLLSDALLSILQLNPWMIGAEIGMSVPVYTGGRLTAQIEIATAEQQQALANYGSVILNAFKEVENDLMYENILAQRLPYQQSVVENRTEAVQIATKKYELGKIDLLPVLQLQTALIASQEEYIKLKKAQLNNRIDLHLALGGNFE